MTTNVYDGAAKIVATDSRWTAEYTNEYGERCVWYCDEGFDKLMQSNGLVFMFAGDLQRIHEWKCWAVTSPTVSTRPKTDKTICICIFEAETALLGFFHGTFVCDFIENQVSSAFAGTGALSAYTCWSKNNCATTAVDTAKKNDLMSGGETKYYNFVDGKTNISSETETDFAVVLDTLHERGNTMSANDKERIVQSADSDSNEEAFNLLASMKAGTIRIEAPTFGAGKDWTDRDNTALDSFLSKHYPR